MSNDNDGWISPDFEDEPSGQVRFDDRGNAVWEAWRRLEHPSLALDDTVNHPRANARVNAFGAKVGYNPYDSGMLDKDKKPRKRDLRALSKWIELEKRRQKG
ncbi:MAG TPA: hypothetical protein VEZ88_08920 [Steroidobacteraceae bacterium]|nr:hypothetical protein [Steroidobacteraceae bacterium]